MLGLNSTYFNIVWYHSDNFDLSITNLPNLWAFLLENVGVVHWKKFPNQINKWINKQRFHKGMTQRFYLLYHFIRNLMYQVLSLELSGLCR